MCVSKCQKFLTFTKQIGTIKSYLEAQMNDQQEEGTQLRSSTWRSYWSVHTSETPNTYKV
jgi:ADP-glucose pyrophosphorylase